MQRNQDYEIYLATLKERNRIAREIHDNVGHMLTRSILQLGALSVINKDETVGEAINDLSGTLNTAMTSIRSSVHDLHDDSIALKPAVEDCIRPLKDRFAVSCDYDFSERMSRDVKLCFIGVIKEALSNTAKHSDGDSIKIIIREHPALYQLSIADNGSCPEKIDESGMGLANMRERAASLNGNINITSGSKAGTYVSGGNMVAPVASSVMGEILPYLGIEPSYTAEELVGADKTVPNVVGLSKDAAAERLSANGFSFRTVGSGDTVTDQTPAGGAIVPNSAEIILYLGAEKSTDKCIVPNVVGDSAATANQKIVNAGLIMGVSGATNASSSTVRAISQSIAAGTEVEAGTVVRVQFSDSSVRD